jgi:hypothetical protein
MADVINLPDSVLTAASARASRRVLADRALAAVRSAIAELEGSIRATTDTARLLGLLERARQLESHIDALVVADEYKLESLKEIMAGASQLALQITSRMIEIKLEQHDQTTNQPKESPDRDK